MSLLGGSRLQGKQETPVVVGHRGCRSGYPENTVLAMRKGIEGGATVIETDIQLASDGTIVHCHDVDTGRCFNRNLDVESNPYNGTLDQLVTKGKYPERMPTLKEVAELFISDKQFDGVRLMLDIKRSNRPHVVPYVVSTLLEVAPLEVWEQKCTFGVWKADVMEAVHQHAPSIPVTFIGPEHRTARYFMEKWPEQVKAISVAFFSYACHGGTELIDYATQHNVKVFSWTVNDPEAMKWAVAARINGVITDYPDVLSHFFDSISEKDMLSEYFTSEPTSFYSYVLMWKMYSLYLTSTAYLALADNLPWFFRRY